MVALMASSSSLSVARRAPLGAALCTGALISSFGTVGRAEAAAGAPVALVAPAPPPATPIAPAPYSPGSLPVGGAAPSPSPIPDYLYFPLVATPGMPGVQLMPQLPSKRVWYGWQTLLVFGGSLGVGLIGGIGGGASGSDAVLLSGLSIGGGGFLLGGPVTHWVHGNVAKGFGSLGLNFGMPVVGGALGAGLVCISAGCDADQGIDIFLGVVVGGSLGLIASMILDVSVLSYENQPTKPVISRRAPGWKIVPDLRITHEKTTFGFAGVF
jgi:hypothetical protein